MKRLSPAEFMQLPILYRKTSIALSIDAAVAPVNPDKRCNDHFNDFKKVAEIIGRVHP